MSTEVLREAAAKMRGRAEANLITPSPWGLAGVSGQGFAIHHGEHDTVALYANRPDAVHIASWHPAVALAVADWLDTAGADLWAHGPLCECGSGCLDCDDDLWQPHVRRALAVAHAYLGADA